MWKLIRNAIGILLLPLLYVVLVEAYSAVAPHLNWQSFRYAILGLVAYAVIHLALFREYHMFTTLEHEFGHAAMGCLFLKLPQVIAGTAKWGGATAIPNGYNFAITLAPYFLPLLTIPLLIAKAVALQWNLLPSFGYIALDFLIGFTLAFHLIGLFEELRPYQTDLKKSGYVFSFVIIGLMNILFLLVIIAVILDDYNEAAGEHVRGPGLSNRPLCPSTITKKPHLPIMTINGPAAGGRLARDSAWLSIWPRKAGRLGQSSPPRRR